MYSHSGHPTRGCIPTEPKSQAQNLTGARPKDYAWSLAGIMKNQEHCGASHNREIQRRFDLSEEESRFAEEGGRLVFHLAQSFFKSFLKKSIPSKKKPILCMINRKKTRRDLWGSWLRQNDFENTWRIASWCTKASRARSKGELL